MRYCAATETGYELMSKNSIAVFTPTFGKDDDGNDIIIEAAKATTQDYLYLAAATIVAAYARANEEPPVTSEDILYDASPTDVMNLLTTVVALRNEWYKVPEVVKPDLRTDEQKGNKKKNAQPPTTPIRK